VWTPEGLKVRFHSLVSVSATHAIDLRFMDCR
jgi:hypothetical protein